MFFDRILPILWPARCAGCNAFVSEGKAFCARCDLSVTALGSCCPGCAMPAEGGQVCRGCRRNPFPFTRALAALAYGGSLTQALLRFKHGGNRHLARPLASFLVPLLGKALDLGVEVACPVPLHPRRLRQRGFNQALELLRVAGRTMAPMARIVIACDALGRTVDTPTLGHESPLLRSQIVANAFKVACPKAIARRRVLIVDDVMTTGATMAECTRTLLAAGAGEVLVAALARAL